MLESGVSRLLAQYLSNVLKAEVLKTQQVSLWSGSLTLHDLDFQLEGFNEQLKAHGQPYKCRRLFVRELHIKVPWSSLWSDSVHIYLDSVEALFTFCPDRSTYEKLSNVSKRDLKKDGTFKVQDDQAHSNVDSMNSYITQEEEPSNSTKKQQGGDRNPGWQSIFSWLQKQAKPEELPFGIVNEQQTSQLSVLNSVYLKAILKRLKVRIRNIVFKISFSFQAPYEEERFVVLSLTVGALRSTQSKLETSTSTSVKPFWQLNMDDMGYRDFEISDLTVNIDSIRAFKGNSSEKNRPLLRRWTLRLRLGFSLDFFKNFTDSKDDNELKLNPSLETQTSREKKPYSASLSIEAQGSPLVVELCQCEWPNLVSVVRFISGVHDNDLLISSLVYVSTIPSPLNTSPNTPIMSKSNAVVNDKEVVNSTVPHQVNQTEPNILNRKRQGRVKKFFGWIYDLLLADDTDESMDIKNLNESETLSPSEKNQSIKKTAEVLEGVTPPSPSITTKVASSDDFPAKDVAISESSKNSSPLQQNLTMDIDPINSMSDDINHSFRQLTTPSFEEENLSESKNDLYQQKDWREMDTKFSDTSINLEFNEIDQDIKQYNPLNIISDLCARFVLQRLTFLSDSPHSKNSVQDYTLVDLNNISMSISALQHQITFVTKIGDIWIGATEIQHLQTDCYISSPLLREVKGSIHPQVAVCPWFVIGDDMSETKMKRGFDRIVDLTGDAKLGSLEYRLFRTDLCQTDRTQDRRQKNREDSISIAVEIRSTENDKDKAGTDEQSNSPWMSLFYPFPQYGFKVDVQSLRLFMGATDPAQPHVPSLLNFQRMKNATEQVEHLFGGYVLDEKHMASVDTYNDVTDVVPIQNFIHYIEFSIFSFGVVHELTKSSYYGEAYRNASLITSIETMRIRYNSKHWNPHYPITKTVFDSECIEKLIIDKDVHGDSDSSKDAVEVFVKTLDAVFRFSNDAEHQVVPILSFNVLKLRCSKWGEQYCYLGLLEEWNLQCSILILKVLQESQQQLEVGWTFLNETKYIEEKSPNHDVIPCCMTPNQRLRHDYLFTFLSLTEHSTHFSLEISALQIAIHRGKAFLSTPISSHQPLPVAAGTTNSSLNMSYDSAQLNNYLEMRTVQPYEMDYPEVTSNPFTGDTDAFPHSHFLGSAATSEYFLSDSLLLGNHNIDTQNYDTKNLHTSIDELTRLESFEMALGIQLLDLRFHFEDSVTKILYINLASNTPCIKSSRHGFLFPRASHNSVGLTIDCSCLHAPLSSFFASTQFLFLFKSVIDAKLFVEANEFRFMPLHGAFVPCLPQLYIHVPTSPIAVRLPRNIFDFYRKLVSLLTSEGSALRLRKEPVQHVNELVQAKTSINTISLASDVERFVKTSIPSLKFKLEIPSIEVLVFSPPQFNQASEMQNLNFSIIFPSFRSMNDTVSIGESGIKLHRDVLNTLSCTKTRSLKDGQFIGILDSMKFRIKRISGSDLCSRRMIIDANAETSPSIEVLGEVTVICNASLGCTLRVVKEFIIVTKKFFSDDQLKKSYNYKVLELSPPKLWTPPKLNFNFGCQLTLKFSGQLIVDSSASLTTTDQQPQLFEILPTTAVFKVAVTHSFAHSGLASLVYSDITALREPTAIIQSLEWNSFTAIAASYPSDIKSDCSFRLTIPTALYKSTWKGVRHEKRVLRNEWFTFVQFAPINLYVHTFNFIKFSESVKLLVCSELDKDFLGLVSLSHSNSKQEGSLDNSTKGAFQRDGTSSCSDIENRFLLDNVVPDFSSVSKHHLTLVLPKLKITFIPANRNSSISFDTVPFDRDFLPASLNIHFDEIEVMSFQTDGLRLGIAAICVYATHSSTISHPVLKATDGLLTFNSNEANFSLNIFSFDIPHFSHIQCLYTLFGDLHYMGRSIVYQSSFEDKESTPTTNTLKKLRLTIGSVDGHIDCFSHIISEVNGNSKLDPVILNMSTIIIELNTESDHLATNHAYNSLKTTHVTINDLRILGWNSFNLQHSPAAKPLGPFVMLHLCNLTPPTVNIADIIIVINFDRLMAQILHSISSLCKQNCQGSGLGSNDSLSVRDCGLASYEIAQLRSSMLSVIIVTEPRAPFPIAFQQFRFNNLKISARNDCSVDMFATKFYYRYNLEKGNRVETDNMYREKLSNAEFLRLGQRVPLLALSDIEGHYSPALPSLHVSKHVSAESVPTHTLFFFGSDRAHLSLRLSDIHFLRFVGSYIFGTILHLNKAAGSNEIQNSFASPIRLIEVCFGYIDTDICQPTFAWRDDFFPFLRMFGTQISLTVERNASSLTCYTFAPSHSSQRTSYKASIGSLEAFMLDVSTRSSLLKFLQVSLLNCSISRTSLDRMWAKHMLKQTHYSINIEPIQNSRGVDQQGLVHFFFDGIRLALFKELPFSLMDVLSESCDPSLVEKALSDDNNGIDSRTLTAGPIEIVNQLPIELFAYCIQKSNESSSANWCSSEKVIIHPFSSGRILPEIYGDEAFSTLCGSLKVHLEGSTYIPKNDASGNQIDATRATNDEVRSSLQLLPYSLLHYFKYDKPSRHPSCEKCWMLANLPILVAFERKESIHPQWVNYTILVTIEENSCNGVRCTLSTPCSIALQSLNQFASVKVSAVISCVGSDLSTRIYGPIISWDRCLARALYASDNSSVTIPLQVEAASPIACDATDSKCPLMVPCGAPSELSFTLLLSGHSIATELKSSPIKWPWETLEGSSEQPFRLLTCCKGNHDVNGISKPFHFLLEMRSIFPHASQEIKTEVLSRKRLLAVVKSNKKEVLDETGLRELLWYLPSTLVIHPRLTISNRTPFNICLTSLDYKSVWINANQTLPVFDSKFLDGQKRIDALVDDSTPNIKLREAHVCHKGDLVTSSIFSIPSDETLNSESEFLEKSILLALRPSNILSGAEPVLFVKLDYRIHAVQEGKDSKKLLCIQITFGPPVQITNYTPTKINLQEAILCSSEHKTEPHQILLEVHPFTSSNWYLTPSMALESLCECDIPSGLAINFSVSQKTCPVKENGTVTRILCTSSSSSVNEYKFFRPLLCKQAPYNESYRIPELEIFPLLEVRNISTGPLNLYLESLIINDQIFQLGLTSNFIVPDQDYSPIDVFIAHQDLSQLSQMLSSISSTSVIKIVFYIATKSMRFTNPTEISLLLSQDWLYESSKVEVSWNSSDSVQPQSHFSPSVELLIVRFGIQIGFPTLWIDIQPHPNPPLTIVNDTPFQLKFTNIQTFQEGSKALFDPPICVKTRSPCSLPMLPFSMEPYTIGTMNGNTVIADDTFEDSSNIKYCPMFRGFRICIMESNTVNNQHLSFDGTTSHRISNLRIMDIGDMDSLNECNVIGYWTPFIQLGEKEKQLVYVLVGPVTESAASLWERKCDDAAASGKKLQEIKTGESAGGVVCIDVTFSPSRPPSFFDSESRFDIATPPPCSCFVSCTFIPLSKNLLWSSITAAALTSPGILGDANVMELVAAKLFEKKQLIKFLATETLDADTKIALPSVFEIDLGLGSFCVDMFLPQILTENGKIVLKVTELRLGSSKSPLSFPNLCIATGRLQISHQVVVETQLIFDSLEILNLSTFPAPPSSHFELMMGLPITKLSMSLRWTTSRNSIVRSSTILEDFYLSLGGGRDDVHIRIEDTGIRVFRRLFDSLAEYINSSIGKQLRNLLRLQVVEVLENEAIRIEGKSSTCQQIDSQEFPCNQKRSISHKTHKVSDLPQEPLLLIIQSSEMSDISVHLSFRITSPVYLSLTSFAVYFPSARFNRTNVTCRQILVNVGAYIAALLLFKSPKALSSLDLLGNPRLTWKSLHQNIRQFFTSSFGLGSTFRLLSGLTSTGASFVRRTTEAVLFNLPDSATAINFLPPTMRDLNVCTHESTYGNLGEMLKLIGGVIVFPITGILATLSLLANTIEGSIDTEIGEPDDDLDPRGYTRQ